MRWIEWMDPWGPENEPIYHRAREDVVVRVQRKIIAEAKPGCDYASDADALADFMAVHWAWFCDPPKEEL